jgi:hypothetical protein
MAEKRGIDLIVMQHHGTHDAPILGSVSYKVGILAKCSVLLLRSARRNPRKGTVVNRRRGSVGRPRAR